MNFGGIAIAFASGLPVSWLAGLTLALISLTITFGGLVAGPLTIFAFLVIPPLTFLPVVRRLPALYLASSLTGLGAGIGGFWISYSMDEWNVPISAAQILLLCSLWIAVRARILWKPKAS